MEENMDMWIDVVVLEFFNGLFGSLDSVWNSKFDQMTCLDNQRICIWISDEIQDIQTLMQI